MFRSAIVAKEIHGNLDTVRSSSARDGAPRLHPVSPFILQGRLFVATPKTSPKAHDQLRDGRYVMHMLPGENDDEFAIRGHAIAITDAETRAMILKDGPHFVKPHDFYFEYRIESAATTVWENVGQPGTRPIRQRWSAS